MPIDLQARGLEVWRLALVELQATDVNPYDDAMRAIRASRWVWILPALLIHKPGPADGNQVSKEMSTDSLGQQKDVPLRRLSEKSSES